MITTKPLPLNAGAVEQTNPEIETPRADSSPGTFPMARAWKLLRRQQTGCRITGAPLPANNADKKRPRTRTTPARTSCKANRAKDTLPDPNTPGKRLDAFVAPDPDKLVRDWSSFMAGPNDAEKVNA
jgi:hypothetical protein